MKLFFGGKFIAADHEDLRIGYKKLKLSQMTRQIFPQTKTTDCRWCFQFFRNGEDSRCDIFVSKRVEITTLKIPGYCTVLFLARLASTNISKTTPEPAVSWAQTRSQPSLLVFFDAQTAMLRASCFIEVGVFTVPILFETWRM